MTHENAHILVVTENTKTCICSHSTNKIGKEIFLEVYGLLDHYEIFLIVRLNCNLLDFLQITISAKFTFVLS